MKSYPLVSLGLPVYNGEEFISDAIESVLQQTFQDFELIITDNGSTDRTQQICEMYAVRDPRIAYQRSEVNLGAAPNFIRAFRLSSGKYFKWIAHDDIIAPQFLERCVEELERDPSVVLCFSNVRIINQENEWVGEYEVELKTDSSIPGERYRSMLLDWHLCFDVFGLIRSEALRRTPIMGNYGHGDGVLLAQLALMGKFYTIRDFLFFSRQHSKQSMYLYCHPLEEGGADYHEYSRWFDTSHKGKIIFPYWRILWEYGQAIRHTELNWKTKILPTMYLLWWFMRSRGHLWRDLVVAGRAILAENSLIKNMKRPIQIESR